MKEIKEGNSPRLILEIKVAYDLWSAGMGVQACATRLLQTASTPKALPDWAREAVVTFSSNYLCQPYVLRFFDPKYSLAQKFSHHLSPSTPQHQELLWRTDEEYEALHWQVARAVLAGDQNISVDGDSSKPITRFEDLRPYLKSAARRGLASMIPPGRLFGSEDGFAGFRFSAHDMGVQLKKKFFNLHEKTLFSRRFRPRLIQAAAHKLGCMLAVTEQIAREAYFSGQPIPASYRPEDQTHQADWKERLGEEMPGIEVLYQQALEVLTAVVDPEDTLINYLFALDVSRYFAR